MQEIIQLGHVGGTIDRLKYYRYTDKQLVLTDDIIGSTLTSGYARICSNGEFIFAFRYNAGWDNDVMKVDKYGIVVASAVYGSEAYSNFYVQGATIVNDKIWVLNYKNTTSPNYLRSMNFDLENHVQESTAVLGKFLRGLWFDGTDLWTFNATGNVLEKRQLTDFTVIVETIPNPVTGFVCYEILPDENTGYLWLQGDLAGNPYVCVYDPVTKAEVSNFSTLYDKVYGLLPVNLNRLKAEGFHLKSPLVIVSGNTLIKFWVVDYAYVPKDLNFIEYSIDNGTTWLVATITSGQMAGLTSSLEGIEHAVVWDTVTDVGYQTIGALIRFNYT